MDTDAVAVDAGRRIRVAVVIGSTRDGRLGAPISEWVAEVARARAELDVEVVDLRAEALPVILPDSSEVPPEVAKLGQRLAVADGFVVVTPEYNHGYPAALKNAIDWFYYEWNAKPVAFVSYGGRSRGVRAAEQLRQVFVELHAMTIRDGVAFDVEQEWGQDERPLDHDRARRSAWQMFDQLGWWARGLRAARAREPYQP